MVVNKSCVAACQKSVRMTVESVSGCSWNECPDQRGITVRMCVEWVSESAWNPQVQATSSELSVLERFSYCGRMLGPTFGCSDLLGGCNYFNLEGEVIGIGTVLKELPEVSYKSLS